MLCLTAAPWLLKFCSDKNHRMSIIKSVQAAINTAIKSAAITEQEDRAQQRAEQKAMHKQALQDSSITAEFYLQGTLHLIQVGEGQQQQQQQQEQKTGPHTKSVCSQPASAVADPGATIDELDEWRQLQQTESPLARVATLQQMIHSGVMPFGLPEATKCDITAAVLQGLPWLRRTKQQLRCWEQQRMASRVQAQIDSPPDAQPTRKKALRQLLAHAVRNVLAAPERYCELKRKALRLQLTAGSSSVHHNTSLQWLEQRSSVGVRVQSLLHTALMRAVQAGEAGPDEQQLRQAMRESRSERKYQCELRGYSRTAYPGLQEVLQEELQQGRAAAEQRRAWLKPARPEAGVGRAALGVTSAARRPASASAATAAVGSDLGRVIGSSCPFEQLTAPYSRSSSLMQEAGWVCPSLVSNRPVAVGGLGSSFSQQRVAAKQCGHAAGSVEWVNKTISESGQAGAPRQLVQVQLK
jgi:hypothetical protein